MPGRPNNATVVDACARRLRALASYVDGRGAIAINGRKLTVAEVVAIYEECLGSRVDLAQKRAIARSAAESIRVQLSANTLTMVAMKKANPRERAI